MAFCSKCGKEINDDAVICIYCGRSVTPQKQSSSESEEDHAGCNSSNVVFAVLGFCIPIVGLIMWLVWKNSEPEKANSAGKGALIGFIVSLVFSIIIAVMYVALIGSLSELMLYTVQ